MSGTSIEIVRVSPLTTVQDFGRPGHFADGISASGPMDAAAFARAGDILNSSAQSGLEFTTAGLSFRVAGGPVDAAFAGGVFSLTVNGAAVEWNRQATLSPGAVVDIRPGPEGNYGYVRFAVDIDVPRVLGSRATNLVVGLGGLEGRALRAGDRLSLSPSEDGTRRTPGLSAPAEAGPVRFIWGIHADRFSAASRQAFCNNVFAVSSKLDRMGVRLTDGNGTFSTEQILSLVSDPIVPGDIQILGDGTPIVLMRDHQPTGGYPRIGTVVSADLDRFAQMRPGTEVTFVPVSVPHARQLLKSGNSK